VYLGLGSNRGDSEAILDAALAELAALLDDIRASSLYRSKARYLVEQPDFLNLVVRGSCRLSPLELLEATQAIEAAHGRDRSKETLKGPRTLDIDLLLYDSLRIKTPVLELPHPGIAERAFVLMPLAELEPGLVDAVSGQSYARLLSLLPEQGIYLYRQARL
jgi:2-amino-4-hydroxy-6-hydroxymethyldihydropteridine diphosphokinase